MKKFLSFFVAIAIAIVFVSCSDDEETPTYDLSGTITNVSNNPVMNAPVGLAKQGETVAIYTATTDAEGKYSFTAVKEGKYSLIVNITGYDLSSTDINLTNTLTQDVKILGSATVSGVIINSQTGAGVPNALIKFTPSESKGENFIGAEITVTTDLYGVWQITFCPTGTFQLRITGTGFTDRIIEGFIINSGENTVEAQTLVEGVSEGQLRIILSWGEEPSDLDSHLTGPSSTSPGTRFHCYYSEQEPDPFISLDLDDTGSYGPETTTINALLDGTYNFSVFNYSDQDLTGAAGIYNSPARVELYDVNGLVATFNPPAIADGNTWFAIKIEVVGGNYTFTAPNEYKYFSGSETVEGMAKPKIKGKHIF